MTVASNRSHILGPSRGRGQTPNAPVRSRNAATAAAIHEESSQSIQAGS